MAGAVAEFTDANFETEVLGSGQPVLVDFWATWCQPCLRLAPTIEALAGEFQGKVKVGKIDTDQNQRTAIKYNVSSIPTLILFKNGEVVDRMLGNQPKDRIADSLNKHA